MATPMHVHTCLLCLNLPFKIKISCAATILSNMVYDTQEGSTVLAIKNEELDCQCGIRNFCMPQVCTTMSRNYANLLYGQLKCRGGARGGLGAIAPMSKQASSCGKMKSSLLVSLPKDSSAPYQTIPATTPNAV